MYPTTTEWDLFFYKQSDLDQLLADATYTGGIVPDPGVSLHLDNATTDYTALQVSPNIQYTSTIKTVVAFDTLPVDFSSVDTDRCGLVLDTDQQGVVWVLFSSVGVAVVIDGVVTQIPDSEQLITASDKVVKLVVDGRENRVLLYVYDLGASEELVYTGELGYDTATADHVRWEVFGSGYRLDVKEWYGSRDADVSSIPDALIISPTQVGVGKYLLLDGRQSSSPDGNTLVYRWSVESAPLSSRYTALYYGETGDVSSNTSWEERITVADGLDQELMRAGDTVWCETRKSQAAAGAFGADGKLVDSTLLLTDSAIFPKNSSKVQLEVLFNSVIADPTSALTYATPDVAGTWKFRLEVTDVVTGLSASDVLVVTVSPSMFLSSTPLDMSMLWNLIGSQWNLVEDKDKIQAIWDAMSLVMSGLLLYIWEVNASKSIATIPRQFVRKWWRLPTFLDALLMGEVIEKYDEVILPIISDPIPDPIVSDGGELVIVVEGTSIAVDIPASPTLDQVVSAINSKWPGMAQADSKRIILDTGGRHAMVADSDVARDLGLLGKYTFLEGTVDVGADAVTLTVDSRFPLDWVADSLSNNWVSVEDGDGLYGTLVRVKSVDVDAGTITLADPLPAGSLTGVSLVFAPRMYQPAVDFDAIRVCVKDSLVYRRGPEQVEELWDIAGSSSQWLMVKPKALAEYGFGEERQLYGLYKRDMIPVFDETVSIPTLRDEVETASTVYYEGQHYIIDHALDSSESWLRCLDDNRLGAAKGWWAEFVYLTADPTIYDNFGVLVDFSPDDAGEQDYLQSVSGLFYLIFRAPALKWVELGVHVVASLPFAEEAGTVLDVLGWWSTDYGRILIAGDSGRVRSYAYPLAAGVAINPETGRRYQVGDRVEQWAPLADGVEVVDRPGWGTPYGLTWLEQVHRYLVRLDADIFPPELVGKMETFLRRISPVWTEQEVRPVKNVIDDIDVRSELVWTPSAMLVDTIGSAYDDRLDGVVGESDLRDDFIAIDSGEWLDNTQAPSSGYIGRYELLSLPESIGGIALSRMWFYWEDIGEPVDEDVAMYIPGWWVSGTDVGAFIQNYNGYARSLTATGGMAGWSSGGKFGDGTFVLSGGGKITIEAGGGAYATVSVLDLWYTRSTPISGLDQDIFEIRDSAAATVAYFRVEDDGSGNPQAVLWLTGVGSTTFLWNGATDGDYHHLRLVFDPYHGKVAVMIDGVFQQELDAGSAVNNPFQWVVGGDGDCEIEAVTFRVAVDYDQYRAAYTVPGHKWPVVFTENYDLYSQVVYWINKVYNQSTTNIDAQVITDSSGNNRLLVKPKVNKISYGGDLARAIGFGEATDWVPKPITVDQDAYNIASSVLATVTETYSGSPPRADSIYFADTDGLYADAAPLTGDQSTDKVLTE